ncbi:MAG: hypothetical protein OEZ59_03455 [Deltaproteobacteria bacterium]|nr:hypothetical protein [Deltaproteobacteria bacterium]
MQSDTEYFQYLLGRLDEAVDLSLLAGFLKYTPAGELAHAPFSLNPFPIPAGVSGEMEQLTPILNSLMLGVSRDLDFLRETLGPAARSDEFLARLLKMLRPEEERQPMRLLATRSDYFLSGGKGRGKAKAGAGDTFGFKQIEMNTIAAGYAGLSLLIFRLHSFLMAALPKAGRMLENKALPEVADIMSLALARYGHPRGRVFMIVQPGESNIFDQRLIELQLRQRGVVTRRITLDELAREGRLEQGHLQAGDDVAAITYFRAGYGPEDLASPEAMKAREMIEASSTICVPTLAEQLAGTKKVQQVLAQPGEAKRFIPAGDVSRVEGVFPGQWDLEQPFGNGKKPAWKAAFENPAGFVLKPQREGGGHNFFDGELRNLLLELPEDDRSAYILMERLRPPEHPALLVRQRKHINVMAVSEVGRFGVLFTDGANEMINKDVGYLVRTKKADSLEGGVSAGFGYLSSLIEQET